MHRQGICGRSGIILQIFRAGDKVGLVGTGQVKPAGGIAEQLDHLAGQLFSFLVPVQVKISLVKRQQPKDQAGVIFQDGVVLPHSVSPGSPQAAAGKKAREDERGISLSSCQIILPFK